MGKIEKYKREAVKGIDQQVGEGEIFGLLGSNGAGKTTSLRMLSTWINPTSGQACIFSSNLLKEPSQVRMLIGYVCQAGGTDVTATARENLMLQARSLCSGTIPLSLWLRGPGLYLGLWPRYAQIAHSA